jgi:hypothetical protein
VKSYRPLLLGFVACSFIGLIGCSPTVTVKAPSEPITINLNIKLDADVRLKLEKTASTDIEKNPGVF